MVTNKRKCRLFSYLCINLECCLYIIIHSFKLLDFGSNFFPFRLFRRDLVFRKANEKSQKIVSLVKYGRKPTKCSSSLNFLEKSQFKDFSG